MTRNIIEDCKMDGGQLKCSFQDKKDESKRAVIHFAVSPNNEVHVTHSQGDAELIEQEAARKRKQIEVRTKGGEI